MLPKATQLKPQDVLVLLKLALQGDAPSDFGEEGEGVLQKLGEAGAFLHAYEELLGRGAHSPKDLQGARESIEQITGVIESLIEDLLSIGDDVRRDALAAFQARGETPTDDGAPAQRSVRVGRNDPCPCGSGKKWKRCCRGAAPSVQ